MSLRGWLSDKLRAARSIVGEPHSVSFAEAGDFAVAAEPAAPDDRWLVGVSLGTPGDNAWSGLVAVRRRSVPSELVAGATVRSYKVFLLSRWQPDTPFAVIAADISAKTAVPPLRECLLPIERTGIGQALYNIIRGAYPVASIRPLTLTNERDVQPDGPGYRVPRADLVAVVNDVLQRDGLDIPHDLQGGDLLLAELRAFKKTGKSAPDVRLRPAEDLALALGSALWLGERYAGGFYMSL